MMSRTELQAVAVASILDASKQKAVRGPQMSGWILARRLGIKPEQRAAFARGVESILTDCHRLGWYDAERVSGLVADWVLEQVTE